MEKFMMPIEVENLPQHKVVVGDEIALFPFDSFIDELEVPL